MAAPLLMETRRKSAKLYMRGRASAARQTTRTGSSPCAAARAPRAACSFSASFIYSRRPLRHTRHRRLGALKCDAFVDLDWSSDAANKPFQTLFPSGRLYTGETDGSSFPNGGLRATHTAAAFTSWDRSSPCFVYDKVLRIPCAFVTHYGRAIDDKTPLLRSQDAVAREGLRLLKACGVEQEASTMYAYLGWEQEFFVVGAELYKKRPDLVNAGRTLFGRLPPRHQSGDLNYFGAAPGPVEDLLIAVQTEMMRMGSPMVCALCGNQPVS